MERRIEATTIRVTLDEDDVRRLRDGEALEVVTAQDGASIIVHRRVFHENGHALVVECEYHYEGLDT